MDTIHVENISQDELISYISKETLIRMDLLLDNSISFPDEKTRLYLTKVAEDFSKFLYTAEEKHIIVLPNKRKVIRMYNKGKGFYEMKITTLPIK